MVQAMACLGGRIELDVLRTAVAEPPGLVQQRLAPALMRVSWSSSRECTRRCSSATTASARRFCVAE